MKILVVDDHPLIREAMHHVLGGLNQAMVVLEAADCECALGLADEHADLDLILLDLGLPGKGGMDALVVLREQHPAVPVVVLSATNDRDTVVEALDRGAMGFIPKSSPNEVMLGALRLVFSGGVYLPPEVFIPDRSAAVPGVVAMAAGTAADMTPMAVADLGITERQLQVLSLMVQGKPNKLICRELGLAESTVKIHVTALLKALNVSNRTQAVIAVGRMGIKLEQTGKPASR